MTDREFSLEWPHGWETVSGHPWTFLAKVNDEQELVGYFTLPSGKQIARNWNLDGTWLFSRTPSETDLRNRPAPKVKKKVWMALLSDSLNGLIVRAAFSEAKLEEVIASIPSWLVVDRFEREIELPAEADHG